MRSRGCSSRGAYPIARSAATSLRTTFCPWTASASFSAPWASRAPIRTTRAGCGESFFPEPRSRPTSQRAPRATGSIRRFAAEIPVAELHVSYGELVRAATEAVRGLGFPFGQADDAAECFIWTEAVTGHGYDLLRLSDSIR